LLAYRRITELETNPGRQVEARRKIEAIQASPTEPARPTWPRPAAEPSSPFCPSRTTSMRSWRRKSLSPPFSPRQGAL